MMSVAHSNIVKRSDIANGLPDPEEILTEWLNLCLSSIDVILRAKIIPVFVFDGGVRPEKERLRAERRADRLVEIEKANKLQETIENAPLQRNEKATEELKKEAAGLWHLSYADLKVFRGLLDVMGFPWFESMYDAEQLCSILCSEGAVHAVYSSDVDSLAFGCPLLISSLKGYQAKSKRINGKYVKMVKVTRLPKLLEELKMTQHQFIDMCILAGCDYNIHLDDIGIAVAYDLIVKYGSIDDIPLIKHMNDANEVTYLIDPNSHSRIRSGTLHPFHHLDSDVCRGIFSHIPSVNFAKQGRLNFIAQLLKSNQELYSAVTFKFR